MALRSTEGLYTGGAVKLDSSPQTNFLIQSLAKKQAQQQALDQYYRNVQERLSDKEVRPQDAEGFQNRLSGMQDYFLTHKKDILGGNIKANSEYNQRYRDAMSYAQNSKLAASQSLLYAQNHFSGKVQPNSNDFNIVLPAMEAPLDDPKHYKDDGRTQPYNINDLSFSQPPLNEKTYMQGVMLGKKQSVYPVGSPENIGGWRMRQNYESGYGDDVLKEMGNTAMEHYMTNKQVQTTATNLFDQLDDAPNLKNNLNDTFKKYYGKDADSPKDYWAAHVINQLNQRTPLQPKEYEDSKARAEYTQGQINARQDKTLSAQGNQFIDTYSNIDKALAAREKNGISWLPISNLNPEDKSPIIAELPKEKKYLTESDLRIIRGTDGTLRVWDNDGNFINFVTKSGTNVKANQPLGQKAKSKSMEQSGSNYTIKGKQYSEKQLLDMGYKLEDIAPFKQ